MKFSSKWYILFYAYGLQQEVIKKGKTHILGERRKTDSETYTPGGDDHYK